MLRAKWKSVKAKLSLDLQRLLLRSSFALHAGSPIAGRWIVAGVETATMLKSINNALPNSFSVNFAKHVFYNFEYDATLYATTSWQFRFKTFYGPWLLGKLLGSAEGVIYVGALGFLNEQTDGRAWEFDFIKNKQRKVVCFFVGSEIRSVVLMREFSERHHIDVVTTYEGISSPGIDSSDMEEYRRRLGEAADRYADQIFNPAVDQMAYIQRKTHPMIYFLPDEAFSPNVKKFEQLDPIQIVHAPTSPIIKGTPLVRAAVKKLTEEGYRFNYRELNKVPHTEVMQALDEAHIVLNEFYALVPGVFGVEAMAKHCALLTSADPALETTLDPSCRLAWRVTPYWQIYDQLKYFLDHPEQIRVQAAQGYTWTVENCRCDNAGKRFTELLHSDPSPPR